MSTDLDLSPWGTYFRNPQILNEGDGTQLPIRNVLNYTSTVSVPTDDPVNQRTNIPFTGGSGPAALGPTITNTGTGTLNAVSTVDGSGNKADVIRFTGTGTVLVNGLDHTGTSRRVRLVPATSGTSLQIGNLAAGAATGQKIELPDGVTSPLSVPPNSVVVVVYDATSSVWRFEGILGAGLTPAGTTGQIQAKSSSGGLEAVPWTYDGTNVVAAKGAPLLVANDAGSGQWAAIKREGTGTSESVSYNGDAAGTSTASAPNANFQATRTAYLGINDESAFVETISAAAGGAAVVGAGPGIAINASASSAIGGGATGYLTLHTTVEPTGAPSTSQGVMLWTDVANSTGQLLSTATRGSVADTVPLTPQSNAYSFPTDANQNLTAAQARWTMFTITAGVITGTRTLTNTAMPPSRSHSVIVQNNTAQAVKYGWSSGTAVSIAAGATAIVSGDGTNATAVTLASGSSGVTFAGDLAGTSSTQNVIQLSGPQPGGGAIPILGSSYLNWDVAATSPTITQTTKSSGTGASMVLGAQPSSSGLGGSLTTQSGNGSSGAGNWNAQLGPTLALQFTPSTLAAGDILSTGSGTVVQAFHKGSNSTILGINGSGVLGYASATVAQGGTGLTAMPGSASNVIINSGGTVYGAASNVTAGTSFVGIGSSVATAGSLRLANTGDIQGLNAAASANITLLQVSASNEVFLGGNTSFSQQATTIRIYAASTVAMGVASGNYLVFNGADAGSITASQSIKVAVTIGGSPGTPHPFAWDFASVAMATTSVTLTPAQYCCPSLTFTGSLSTGATALFPNTTAAEWRCKNNSGQVLTVKVSGQSGFNIASGGTALFRSNGTDLELIAS